MGAVVHGAMRYAASAPVRSVNTPPEDLADRLCRWVVRGVERIAEWAHQGPRPLDIPRDDGMLVTTVGPQRQPEVASSTVVVAII